MKNKLIYILLAIFIVLAILGVIGKNKGWFGQKNLPRVAVEEAGRVNIIETVTANGKIFPENEVKISSDVSGEIIELFVEVGDSVRKGQQMARIQPDSYQALLDQTEAQLNAAKADLATARAREQQALSQVERTRDVVDRNRRIQERDPGLIAEEEIKQAQASLKAAEAELQAAREGINAASFMIESAEARKREAKSDVSKTSIFSPLDGIVTVLNVEKGEKVVGTFQMQGTEMMRIADFNLLEIRVEVSENDIIRVSQKDTALIEVDAYEDRAFKGIVTKIAKASQGLGRSSLQVNQSTNFEVRIRILPESYADLLEKYNYPFLPGMSATVDIQTDRKTKTLAVPIQAVTTRKKDESRDEDEREVVVFLLEQGKAVKRQVKTGIQDDNFIEILEGLEEGNTVISDPYGVISRELEDGQEVEVVEREELFK